MPRMRKIGRHRNVIGATITESVDEDDNIRRFTATIRGFQNWRLFEGKTTSDAFKKVIAKVKEIRDRIDNGDESVFYEDCTIS
jgi:hypothetical protein